MTTQTPLQVALDKRIPPILEQLERLRRDCGLQYLADVCLKHANALAELALRAEGYDVGGTNCIPHLLASLGVLERDMVRIEVASTDLATSPLTRSLRCARKPKPTPTATSSN